MIRHLAGIAEIVEDVEKAADFWESLGLKVRREQEGYAVVEVPGVLHFGLWSRASAAESTFGDPGAADRVPLGFTIGLEADDVERDADGIDAVRGPQDEPWGQRTLRFLSPSGALTELCETPGARELASDVRRRVTDA